MIPGPDRFSLPGDRGADALRDAHEAVLERITRAAQRARRDPAQVTLVAVSKTVSVPTLRLALEAGIRTFGENRVQEASAKRPALGDALMSWHLVGPLQANKARKAIEVFDVLESIDSVGIARRVDLILGGIERAEGVEPPLQLPVLLQVNVDGDPAKAGFAPNAVDVALEELETLRYLRVDGLMTVGRLVPTPEDARPTFRALRELSERLRARHPRLGAALSMGMTDDFEVAIEEGATIVRIGRAIFGERPPG